MFNATVKVNRGNKRKYVNLKVDGHEINISLDTASDVIVITGRM